jgi:CubicO group peptidase (beta-lactamase class C family)
LSAVPLRVWTPAELLAAIPPQRTTPGAESLYGNINYLLLGVVIEEVTGRPVAEVLREGVLGIDHVERLIYQPDEVPTEPIAIENGQSTAWHESMGGFLPSLALTSDGAAAAMASDAVSLANWWRAFCGGDWGIVGAVGHGGSDHGNNAMADCLRERGVAFEVRANRGTDVLDTRTVAAFLVHVVKQP